VIAQADRDDRDHDWRNNRRRGLSFEARKKIAGRTGLV
jgi:hypothetical protein